MGEQHKQKFSVRHLHPLRALIIFNALSQNFSIDPFLCENERGIDRADAAGFRRHNARIGPSWLIALLVEEDNNSKLEWPRERWADGSVRAARSH